MRMLFKKTFEQAEELKHRIFGSRYENIKWYSLGSRRNGVDTSAGQTKPAQN